MSNRGLIYLLIFSCFFFACSFINDISNSNIIIATVRVNDINMISTSLSQAKRYNKLMVVAHPDDDTIFGGAHLINDDYYVVCVTCGSNEKRLNEFYNVMNKTDDIYATLNHSDVVNGYISDWKDEEDNLKSELNDIIKKQSWDLIVTHNPDGEYGHKHHKKISKIVTDLVEDKSKLNYFGIYHDRKFKDGVKLDLSIMNEKKDVLSLYVSQHLNEDSKYLYMFEHENWIKYSDWKLSRFDCMNVSYHNVEYDYGYFVDSPKENMETLIELDVEDFYDVEVPVPLQSIVASKNSAFKYDDVNIFNTPLDVYSKAIMNCINKNKVKVKK